MAITVGTVYSTQVAQSFSAASNWSITGISVPSDATAAILICMGYRIGSGVGVYPVDVSNFEGDAHNHFTDIVHQDDGGAESISAGYLLYGQTGFPTRGASNLTLTGSFNGSPNYGEAKVILFFLSGSVVDAGTFIIGTNKINSDSEDNWVSASLGTLAANDLGFIAGLNYDVGAEIDPVPTGSGQTQLVMGNDGGAVFWGAGYEAGEDTPGLTEVANHLCGIAFAVKAAPARLLHTVAPSGADFTTLADCAAHLESSHPNLVSSNEYADIEISGNWSSADTAAVDFHNVVTDETHYIYIYTTGAARHQGKWDAAKYVLNCSRNNDAGAIGLYCKYTILDGLQIDVPGTNSSNHAIRVAAGGMKIRNNLLKKQTGTSAWCAGIIVYNLGSSLEDIYIYNNVFYDWTGSAFNDAGIMHYDSAVTVYSFNNTYHGCAYGHFKGSSGTDILTNCLFQGSTNWDINDLGLVTDTYCATDKSSSASNLNPSGTGNRFSQTFSFVDPDNDDFHLLFEDTGAKNHGLSDPGSGLFSTDIDGKTRSGSWDIGADEVGIVFVNGAFAEDVDYTPAFNAIAGNTIIVFTENYTSAGVKTVSEVNDTAGNTYTKCGNTESGNEGVHGAECWVATNILGNANNVVTITWDSPGVDYQYVAAVQYANLATSNVYDKGSAGLVTTGLSHTGNDTETTSQADEVIVGFAVAWSGAIEELSATLPYRVRVEYPEEVDKIAVVDRIVSSTGIYNITYEEVSGESSYFTMVRTFKMAVAETRQLTANIAVTSSTPSIAGTLITYFGETNAPNSSTGSISTIRSQLFTCPGSGNQIVKEISAYCQMLSALNIRLAIYDSSNNLVCQGVSEVVVSGTFGWQGHLTQASITPNPATLTGGQQYRIAWTYDGGNFNFGYDESESNIQFYDETDRTGGFPSTLGDLPNDAYGSLSARIGVEAAGTTTRQLTANVAITSSTPNNVVGTLISYIGLNNESYQGLDDVGIVATNWNNVMYQCPGSGNLYIQELSLFCYQSHAVNIRLAIYSSDGSQLIAEGIAEAAVSANGGSPAWQGHMTQASIRAAGGSSPGILVGGTSYLIVFSVDYAGSGIQAGYRLSNAIKYASVDNTGGFGSSLPAGSDAGGMEYCLRCKVSSVSEGGGISIPVVMHHLRQQGVC